MTALSRILPLRILTGGSRNRLVSLAWAAACLLTAAAAWLLALSYRVPVGPRWGPRGFIGVFAVMFSSMGLVVATRRPHNRIGWIYLVAGLLCAIQVFGEEYAAYALLVRPGTLPAAEWLAWLQNWIWVPVVGLYMAYIPMLLPEGRLPSPRWRPLAWYAALATAIQSFVFAVRPGRLANFYPLVNPLSLTLPAMAWVRADTLAFGLTVLAILASAASLVLRVRHASAIERQQLKWVAIACGLGAAGFLASVLFGQYSAPSAPLILGGILAMHIATGLAIMRYRLYDIDVIINRTLVYAALTVALAGVYFASVVILQQLSIRLTGQRQSEFVTVLSTLAIAGLFTPLRRRLQGVIDRRFYRHKYDAAQALARFSAAIRSQAHADLQQMTESIVAVVEDTLQPASASLWVRPSATRNVQSARDKALRSDSDSADPEPTTR